MEEITEGCLAGPFSAQQLNEKFGKHWLPARRFPVVQGIKIRPVDDFSQFGVNAAFGTAEKISMLGVDQVVGWAKAWCESTSDDRSVSLLDSAGQRYSGWLHEDWELDDWRHLLGRVADLKNAYKQLPRHPAHAVLSIIAVPDPHTLDIAFFEAYSLMFGEAAAVYAFLRFSRALSALACSLFRTVAVEFFDDFSQIEPKVTSNSAQRTLESLFDLLGWKVSMGEDKRKVFEHSFVSLGVLVDYSNLHAGEVLLKNKPGRIEGIKDQLKLLVDKGLLRSRDALSLRGKIYFAEGQIFGRIAAPIVHSLSRW